MYTKEFPAEYFRAQFTRKIFNDYLDHAEAGPHMIPSKDNPHLNTSSEHGQSWFKAYSGIGHYFGGHGGYPRMKGQLAKDYKDLKHDVIWLDKKKFFTHEDCIKEARRIGNALFDMFGY